MKVSADPSLCEAHGECTAILPGVFDLDDDELLQIRPGELSAAEEEPAARAVAACPKGALRLSR